MQQDQAYEFVNKVMQHIVVDADYKNLDQIYHTDVIGHYGDTEFNFDDIVNRITYLNKVFKNRNHVLHEVIVADEKLVFRNRQIFTHAKTDELLVTEVTGVYTITDNKVAELWLMTDKKIDYYESPEHGLCVTKLPNEKDCKSRKQFQKLITSEQFMVHGNLQTVALTDREIEVLFYTMRGMTAKEIGQRLTISFRTVESYIETLREKFDVGSKAELRRKITPGALWL